MAMASKSLFTPKSSIRIRCWNVRSLGNPSKQNGRLKDVLRTVKEKDIEVLALSEVRWPDHGVAQVGETVVAFSGMVDSSRQCRSCGVAVMLGKRAVTAWKAAGSVFEALSDRMMRVRLKLHTGFVSIIAVYAPTNEPKNEGESVEFYQSLQKVVRQIDLKDTVLIMGISMPGWEMMLSHGMAL